MRVSVLSWVPLFVTPMNYRLSGISVHGVPLARILEWDAISYSWGPSWSRDGSHTSCISCTAGRICITSTTCHVSVSGSVMSDSATPWTVACQAPLFMEFQAKILEWVAISSSRKSSQPRDQTHVSCIGRRTLYHWATREAPDGHGGHKKLK